MSECPATGDGATAAAGVPADWPTLPGYEILGELGRGGMGVVYKARQVNLKRWVALKVMRDAALASAQERGRFRIEAEAAARMRHPNIVQIYEVSEHQGRPYFVMELVEGGRLDHYIAGRPQDAALAAELVRTLAHAVQHAHGQHIIHRDLKPANILLVSGGVVSGEWSGTGAATTHHSPLTTPKITDFGLAKRLDTESTAWTQDGAILGTASYMAPEQAAGRVGAVGPAVDVYALGAILYELLTGRPPFRTESWGETIQKVLHDEPALPRRLRPDIPCDLETVCLKCLDKEPGQRYASAQELADDLGRFLEGQPVVAVPLDERGRLARLAVRDGYQLLGEIGRGPRSTVYHALYEPLQQPVAVKVFAAGACPRDVWEARLRAGAHLGAVVAHPQVIPIHRAGWWDDAPYVAVEYVPQGSLAGKLVGRPYPVREALRLVEQLAEIVSYLHRQGVVHGNLKPSNVLLAADGIPRLTDFRPTGGLVQGALDRDSPEPIGLAYLAPELVRDAGAEPRPYTDIYGLGVILYELLTGRPPFAGANTREVLEHVCKREPVPPSRFNREVTPHLAACCLRCLRKDPWRRYSRAYDLLTRLRQFKVAPSNWAASGERWPKRRPGEDDSARARNP